MLILEYGPSIDPRVIFVCPHCGTHFVENANLCNEGQELVDSHGDHYRFLTCSCPACGGTVRSDKRYIPGKMKYRLYETPFNF